MVNTNSEKSNLPRMLLGILAILSLAWFLFKAIKTGCIKYFSIDEFYYAHASWLISNGLIPYKDFYLDKHPLLCQILSSVFIFADDDPTSIRCLRYAMLVPMVISMICLWRLTNLKSRLQSLMTPLILLSCYLFTMRITEIRPDSIALCISCALFVLVLLNVRTSLLIGVISGSLYILAIWASKKAILYTMGVPLFLVVGSAFKGKSLSIAKDFVFSAVRPRDFLIGVAGTLVLIMTYLVSTNSLIAWFEWGFFSAWEYLMKYPSSEVDRTHETFSILASTYWYMFPLLLSGLVGSLSDLRKSRDSRNRQREFLLLSFFIGSMILCAIQRSAHVYNLMPLIASSAIYVSKGIFYLYSIIADSKERNRELLVFGFISLFAYSVYANFSQSHLGVGTNKYQLEVLSKISQMTDVDDVIYDNSGSFVSRPSVDFFFQTCKRIREQHKDYLINKIPKGILAKECSVFINDARTNALPVDLRKFLFENFVPYDGNIFIWGKKFSNKVTRMKRDEFYAVKDGLYFVYPERIIDDGLWINGEKIEEQIFQLKKGSHDLFHTSKDDSFYIIWLPRDSEIFEPDYSARRRFSIVL